MVDYFLEILLQLIVLFGVIFDPPASLAVFATATESLKPEHRHRIATYAILVACGLSLAVLIFGAYLLTIFNTTVTEFRIAGGIILGILGVKMALGIPLHRLGELKDDTGLAIAAIIGTPLLTGPAAITAIIVSIEDFGRFTTGLAIAIVLFVTAIMFYKAEAIFKHVGKTAIQILSTVLGLITLSWGIRFIMLGLRAMLH